MQRIKVSNFYIDIEMTQTQITQLEETGPTGFAQFQIQVPHEFQDVFSHFYYCRNGSAEQVTKTLLPGFQTIVAFNFGASVQLLSNEQATNENFGKKADHTSQVRLRMGKYGILGPIKKAFSYTVPPGAELFTLNFRQDAFFRFFGQRPNAIETPLNPDLLIGQGCFGQWWQTLAQMEGLQDRVDYLLDSCRPYIGEQDHRIAQAIQLGQNLHDLPVDPVKTMAMEARQSIRNMQLQFQKQLGYSAKAYLRNQRFIQAILLIQMTLDKGEKPDWFTIIDACHYYDQSQLIKDFKYFMDLTPTKYLQFQGAICHAPSDIS